MDDKEFEPKIVKKRKRSHNKNTKKSKNKKPPQWFLDYMEDDEEDTESESLSEEEQRPRRPRNAAISAREAIREELSKLHDSEDEDEDEDVVEYFEHDLKPLEDSIVKHIASLLGKDQREALLPKIERGVQKAFELFKDLLEEKFNSLFGSMPTSNLWKLGLGPNEIQEYAPMIRELRQGHEKDRVDIKRILDTKLEFEAKQKLLQMYDLLQNVDEYTPEYLALESAINSIIKVAEKSPLDTKQVAVLKQQEEELLKKVEKVLPLKARILNADMDDSRKAAIYEKYLTLAKNPEDSVTAASMEEWIEEALKTPFTKMAPSMLEKASAGECLLKLKEGFQSRLSELDAVLEPLLAIFNNRLHNPEQTPLVIGLIGSPGLGKTQIGKVIADVWEMPFQQISLGGVVDSSILDGQHPGWVGSSPGRFAKALQEMGVINGILFLDEIDKLGDTPNGLQVQYSLLHSTDPIQNKEFHDHYLGNRLPLDLSKCVIICALNRTVGIDPALLNRMSLIRIPDYGPAQKTRILKKHLFPEALEATGLTEEEVQLTESGCSRLLTRVEDYAGKEGGVRSLKAAIRMIVDKLALLIRVSPEEQEQLKLSYSVSSLPAGPNKSKELPVKISATVIDNLYHTEQEKGGWINMYL